MKKASILLISFVVLLAGSAYAKHKQPNPADFPLRLLITGRQTVVVGVTARAHANAPTPVYGPLTEITHRIRGNRASGQARQITEMHSTGVLRDHGQKYAIALVADLAPSGNPYLARWGKHGELDVWIQAFKKDGKPGKVNVRHFKIVSQQIEK